MDAAGDRQGESGSRRDDVGIDRGQPATRAEGEAQVEADGDAVPEVNVDDASGPVAKAAIYLGHVALEQRHVGP